MKRRAVIATIAVAVASITMVTGCQQSSTSAEKAKTVTVVTHDSFELPDELVKNFESTSGYTVKFVAPGNAGTMVNQLILTKDSPIGDVAFGIDNTLGGRALDSGIVAEYRPSAHLINSTLNADDSGRLTPITRGDVCVNADLDWFKAHPETPMPSNFDDLAQPALKGLLVVENPATSSPGLAFLGATKAVYGDSYLDYWQKLKENDVKVVSGWTDAYSVEFTRAGGTRPLVVSYSSSPAYELVEGSTTQSHTTALLQTCFQQVEYAAVLTGAANPEGARAFIDFLLSDPVQKAIPTSMYVYPARTDVALPPEWATVAQPPEKPLAIAPEEFSANFDSWVKAWTEKVIG